MLTKLACWRGGQRGEERVVWALITIFLSLAFLTVCSLSNSSPSRTALKFGLCSCPEYGLITRNLVLVLGASQKCSKPDLWVRSPHSFLCPGPLQSKWLFPHCHCCSHTWHCWQLLNPWNSSVWVLLKPSILGYFLAIFPQAPLIAVCFTLSAFSKILSNIRILPGLVLSLLHFPILPQMISTALFQAFFDTCLLGTFSWVFNEHFKFNQNRAFDSIAHVSKFSRI